MVVSLSMLLIFCCKHHDVIKFQKIATTLQFPHCYYIGSFQLELFLQAPSMYNSNYPFYQLLSNRLSNLIQKQYFVRFVQMCVRRYSLI